MNNETTEERKLACKLANPELRERSKELADVLHEYDEIEAQKKAVTADLGEKLKKLRAEATELADIVKHGREFSYVACTWTEDHVSGKRFCTRDDTGEIIETLDLARQTSLLS